MERTITPNLVIPFQAIQLEQSTQQQHHGRRAAKGRRKPTMTNADSAAPRRRSWFPSNLFSSQRETKQPWDDLVVVGQLGRGGFGTVFCVQNTKTKEVWAVKQVSKAFVEKQGRVESILREKEIASSLSSRFLVSVDSVFHDKNCVYLKMPICLGGSLHTLQTKFRRFPPEWARFYAACVFTGLTTLHKHKIIYRDVKHENILLDSQGYAHLCDFGLSKRLAEDSPAQTKKQMLRIPTASSEMSADSASPGTFHRLRSMRHFRTYTKVGTKEFLSPEVLTGQGYTIASDYYAFGKLVFQMLAGLGDELDLTSTHLTESSRSLIEQLTDENPLSRLGSVTEGANWVTNHPWFENLDWAQLAQGLVKPPWVPSVQDSTDLRYFPNDGKLPSPLPLVEPYTGDSPIWNTLTTSS